MPDVIVKLWPGKSEEEKAQERMPFSRRAT